MYFTTPIWEECSIKMLHSFCKKNSLENRGSKSSKIGKELWGWKILNIEPRQCTHVFYILIQNEIMKTETLIGEIFTCSSKKRVYVKWGKRRMPCFSCTPRSRIRGSGTLVWLILIDLLKVSLLIYRELPFSIHRSLRSSIRLLLKHTDNICHIKDIFIFMHESWSLYYGIWIFDQIRQMCIEIWL